MSCSSPPKGIIRVVTSEAENVYSTESMKKQYPQSKSVHRFRIDIKLVVEAEEGGIDVTVGECTKNDDSRSINDNAKLLRECKDTIGGLVNSEKHEC